MPDPAQPSSAVPAPTQGAAVPKPDAKPSAELEQFLADGTEVDPKTGGPEKLELSLTVPEHLKDRVSADQVKLYIDRARDIARREGVPAAKAQAFLQELANLNFDLAASQDTEAVTQQEQQAQELVLAWKREIATDPQLGGTRYTQTMVDAEDGARRLGGHALAVAFIRHLRGEEVMPGPMLVKAFQLAAATMREDRIHGLTMKRGPETRTLEQALYGSQPKG